MSEKIVFACHAGFCLDLALFRMIGLMILVAQIIILMTRMIAQICKNTIENRENTPKGAAAKRPRGAAKGRACVFSISHRVFAYLGYHPGH